MGKSTICNYHYIYLTYDNKYNKWYCGKRSSVKPIEEDFYYGSGNIIKRILNKYSKEEIEKRLKKIILHVSNTYDENCKMEKFWVDEVFNAPNNPNFYNIANGGGGGNLIKGYTDEQKKEHYKIIGASNKGKIHSEESKLKISKGGKGKLRSDETKKNISNAKIGEGNSFFGKIHSEETRQKISEKLKDENNPMSINCLVVDSKDEVIFKGIRKEVINWAKNNKICSESTVKLRLSDGECFYPKYKVEKYNNAFDYIGIKFMYEN